MQSVTRPSSRAKKQEVRDRLVQRGGHPFSHQDRLRVACRFVLPKQATNLSLKDGDDVAWVPVWVIAAHYRSKTDEEFLERLKSYSKNRTRRRSVLVSEGIQRRPLVSPFYFAAIEAALKNE